MPTTPAPAVTRADPLESARTAIWLLFLDHHIDETTATTCLLAIDVGARRAQRREPLRRAA